MGELFNANLNPFTADLQGPKSGSKVPERYWNNDQDKDTVVFIKYRDNPNRGGLENSRWLI